MRVVLLSLLVLTQSAQDPAPTIEGFPDAWPERERTAAQRFGMKTIENLPVPELDAGPGDQRNVRLKSAFRTRSAWRVIAIKVSNPAPQPLDCRVVLPQLDLVGELHVPAFDWNKTFFMIEEDPKRTSLLIEVRRNAALLASSDMKLTAARTGTKWQAAILVDEFRREMDFRLKWPRHRARIETAESATTPLPDASLTLLHKSLGLRVTVKTDAQGVWTGRLLGGEWVVYARKEIRRTPKPVATKDGQTTAEMKPAIDLYYLAGPLAVGGREEGRLRLAPERRAPLRMLDTRDAAIFPERYAITPCDIGPALRYQLAHGAAAEDFILRCAAPTTEPTLHATANLSFEVQAWASTAPAERILSLEPKVQPDKDIVLAVKGRDIGRLRFEPASIPGGDRLAATLSMPDAARETYAIETREPMTVYVPAGLIRCGLRLHSGPSVYHFAPEAFKVQPAESVDLSPRGLQVLPHWLEYRGLQVWVCVMDSRERFITRVEKGEGLLQASTNNRPLFEEKLEQQLTFHYPDQFKDVPYAGIIYSAAVRVGTQWVKSAPARALPRKQFGDPPAFVMAPEKMRTRARPMLPMVQKTLAMCLERFGFAKLDQLIDVMIRMPPELPMLAGGDRVILEMTSCLDYAHETDTFDRTFPHELGHNLGFGHDSYMAIAYHGCDEGLLGWPGYVLQVGKIPNRLLEWLDRDQHDSGEWSPSGDLYASMRLMYGPLAHKRMFEARKKHEKKLIAAGFSVEERIAAFYSAATDLNLGWMFRAHGWPVFDYRVQLALVAMADASLAGEFKINEKIDGSFLTTWWMRGPIDMAKEADLPPWKMHAWPGRFLRIADEDTVHKEQAFHFYLTLGSDATRAVFLCISTDSQVDVYLDGQRVTRVFAAPQKTQPAHDDYTLGRVQATRVPLLLHEGGNAVELVVVKPAGSKGMFIELAGQNGRPVPGIGHALDYGPDDRTKADGEKVQRPMIPAVCNGSMEAGKGVPDAWIMASKDGDGNVLATLDDKIKAHGERSLRLELDGPVRGNVIQRCIVDEEGEYELTGFVRTEGFKEGDVAFVMLFWGQPEEGTGWAHSDIVTKTREWKAFRTKWKADRRAAYVGCVLRGGAGAKAWFDQVQLTKLR